MASSGRRAPEVGIRLRWEGGYQSKRRAEVSGRQGFGAPFCAPSSFRTPQLRQDGVGRRRPGAEGARSPPSPAARPPRRRRASGCLRVGPRRTELGRPGVLSCVALAGRPASRSLPVLLREQPCHRGINWGQGGGRPKPDGPGAQWRGFPPVQRPRSPQSEPQGPGGRTRVAHGLGKFSPEK